MRDIEEDKKENEFGGERILKRKVMEILFLSVSVACSIFMCVLFYSVSCSVYIATVERTGVESPTLFVGFLCIAMFCINLHEFLKMKKEE